MEKGTVHEELRDDDPDLLDLPTEVVTSSLHAVYRTFLKEQGFA